MSGSNTSCGNTDCTTATAEIATVFFEKAEKAAAATTATVEIASVFFEKAAAAMKSGE
jgi:hypothetical protein